MKNKAQAIREIFCLNAWTTQAIAACHCLYCLYVEIILADNRNTSVTESFKISRSFESKGKRQISSFLNILSEKRRNPYFVNTKVEWSKFEPPLVKSYNVESVFVRFMQWWIDNCNNVELTCGSQNLSTAVTEDKINNALQNLIEAGRRKRRRWN